MKSKKDYIKLPNSAYTSNRDVIEFADKYSHDVWEKLMDNFKKIENYHIGCNDVSDIVLNAIINTYNWLEKQGEKNINHIDIKEKAHQIAWETSKNYDPSLSKESWCEMAALDMASWLETQGEQKPIDYNEEFKTRCVADTAITKTRNDMKQEEFLDRIDEIMCGTSNAERAYLEDLYDEVTKPHWISVEDELPKEHEWILGFSLKKSYIDVYNFDSNGLIEAHDITHWIPIPEAPKKGEQHG